MSTHANPFITPEQYLEIERAAEFKSEYYDGEMFAMSGAREPHNIIVTNTAASLHGQFRKRPCRVYHNDMRVQLGTSRRYTYPDVIAVCGERQFLDRTRDTLLNPVLIVEVLSASTENFDRGKKFFYYRSIPSFVYYLLLASDRICAELHTREPDGGWHMSPPIDNPQAVIELPALDCRLALTDLYEDVEFISSEE